MIRNVLVLFATGLASCAIFSGSTAHAQLGLYGEVTVDQISGIQSVYGSAYSNSVNPLGGTGGLYYDFRNLGPARLGIDLRGSILTSKRGALINADGAGSRLDSGLVGVRGSFHTFIAPLKPYLEAAGGIGRSNFGVIGPTLTNGFEYHIFAGADLRLLSVMDFRVVEIGYGGLDANSHNFPLKSVSTGVVFHLPSLP